MSGMSEIGRRPEGLTGPESNIVKNAVEQGTERMNPAVLADLEGCGKKMKPSVLADLEGRTKKPELSMQDSLAEGKEKIRDVVINAAENIPIKALRPEIIQTYNQNLEGQVHPNADVRYGKSIFMFNGKIMEGVFPRFHAVYSESGEHLFSDVLRFDSGETRKVTAYDAMEEIQNKELIPFAKDPFGNYICLSLKYGTVRFWDHEDHETGTTAMAGRNLQDFIENLHE